MKQLQLYSKYVSSKQEQDYLNKLVADIGKMNSEESSIQSDFQFGKSQAGYALLYGDMAKFTNDFESTVNKVFAIKTNQAKSRNESNTLNFYISIVVMAAVMLLATAISILLGIFNARTLSKPIKKLVDAADLISSGNLDVDIDVVSRG